MSNKAKWAAATRKNVQLVALGDVLRNSVTRRAFTVEKIEVTPNGLYYVFTGAEIKGGEESSCMIRKTSTVATL